MPYVRLESCLVQAAIKLYSLLSELSFYLPAISCKPTVYTVSVDENLNYDCIILCCLSSVFFYSEDVSLMPVKWAIKAVLLNDMVMLKDAIESTQKVYTVCVPECTAVNVE